MTETPAADLRERIVDTALALAERQSWEAVRLHRVARTLDVSLNALRQYFREKEDIVDAWFDRADAAMLETSEEPGFEGLCPRLRLHRLIMSWLGALAPHRRVTRQMIVGKLEPGHVHIQVPGLMRVSRTVQWLREAAQRDATLPRRALEETALTSIYLMTFFFWMGDNSAGSARTSRFLDRWLVTAERLNRRLYGARPAGGAAAPATSSAHTQATGH